MIERAHAMAGTFDVIHSHIDTIFFPMARRIATPVLSTLHGRLDIPDLVPLFLEFTELPVISISDAQREPLPWINWQRTIPHGLPRDLFSFTEKSEDYLAFLGRISPEKGVDYAIEIAKRAGRRLKIAAKVDKPDKEYFDTVIKPLLGHPLIEYIGEIGESEKNEFLGNAAALLFPIDWPEPFGLVMIEAMACGTPVIARSKGSVPEVIRNGENGFIIHTIDEAVHAIDRLPAVSRHRCRQLFEERFTVQRMAQDYVEAYRQLIDAHNKEKSVQTKNYGRYYPD
jgi:glycosyltransferase involved in cell wall biosynthesis